MSVRGNLYLALAAELYRPAKGESIPLFNTVDLYNNQFEYLEDEKPFAYPCAFIEFVSFTWKQLGNKVQEGKLVFNIHLGYKNGTSTRYAPDMDVKGLESLGLIDEVFKRLSGFRVDDLITGITRTGSLYDHNHDQINVQVEQFTALVYDTSAMPQYTKVAAKADIQRI